MSKIMNAYNYSEEEKKLIKSISKESDIWSLDEIIDLKKEIRNFYRKEQKILCAYCRNPVSLVYPDNCHVEHIAPKSLYPEYIFVSKNLCVICADCNKIKRNQETIDKVPDTIKKKLKTKYPDKSEHFNIVHPHFDNYDDHIHIENGFYIDKASKKGNFTIGACLLNRKFLFMGWEPQTVNNTEMINKITKIYKEPKQDKRDDMLQKIIKELS
ncbi:HNH endonuclease [Chryseobacterium sp. WX]|uniref:HNH endonuclease n=1 Tax=Chryseobacterium sp. WX TaxID=3031803 RepID=UPI00240A27DE|nr:HNH endonuclease [Chryseobacterium sp. WX]WFB70046.1 hypothetical protein PZ898_11530 [Chryseobacterium sp. WX]